MDLNNPLSLSLSLSLALSLAQGLITVTTYWPGGEKTKQVEVLWV